MGYQTYAPGGYSFAMGEETTALGDWSTAMGNHTSASGSHSAADGLLVRDQSGVSSTAWGTANHATGDYSTAMGLLSWATGYSSTAMCNSSWAEGYYSLAAGKYVDRISICMRIFRECELVPGDSSSYGWVETDPILLVGNGYEVSHLATGFTATLKNGQTTLTNKSWKAAEPGSPFKLDRRNSEGNALDGGGKPLVLSRGIPFLKEGHHRAGPGRCLNGDLSSNSRKTSQAHSAAPPPVETTPDEPNRHARLYVP